MKTTTTLNRRSALKAAAALGVTGALGFVGLGGGSKAAAGVERTRTVFRLGFTWPNAHVLEISLTEVNFMDLRNGDSFIMYEPRFTLEEAQEYDPDVRNENLVVSYAEFSLGDAVHTCTGDAYLDKGQTTVICDTTPSGIPVEFFPVSAPAARASPIVAMHKNNLMELHPSRHKYNHPNVKVNEESV